MYVRACAYSVWNKRLRNPFFPETDWLRSTRHGEIACAEATDVNAVSRRNTWKSSWRRIDRADHARARRYSLDHDDWRLRDRGSRPNGVRCGELHRACCSRRSNNDVLGVRRSGAARKHSRTTRRSRKRRREPCETDPAKNTAENVAKTAFSRVGARAPANGR